MRGDKDLYVEVQHIHISMRDEGDLLMEVQQMFSSKGGKDLPMKVQHIHIVMREGNDLPVEV